MKVEFPEGMIEGASKGDSFSYEEIKPMLPIHSREDRQLFVLKWKEALDKELERVGKQFMIRTRNRGRLVQILTDEEALDYGKSKFRGHQRGGIRTNDKTQAIDRNNLDADDRRRLEQELMYQSPFVAAILAPPRLRHGDAAQEVADAL